MTPKKRRACISWLRKFATSLEARRHIYENTLISPDVRQRIVGPLEADRAACLRVAELLTYIEGLRKKS